MVVLITEFGEGFAPFEVSVFVVLRQFWSEDCENMTDFKCSFHFSMFFLFLPLVLTYGLADISLELAAQGNTISRHIA